MPPARVFIEDRTARLLVIFSDILDCWMTKRISVACPGLTNFMVAASKRVVLQM
jgi:hypothetical protein